MRQLAAGGELAPGQEAVLALCRLADEAEGRRDMLSLKVSAPLCGMLQAGAAASLQVPAATALSKLAAASQPAREAIRAAGAIPLLASLLDSGNRDGSEAALGTLSSAALDRDCQKALLAAGVVKRLPAFLEPSASEPARRAAAALLRNLTAYDGCGKALCAEPGLLQAAGQLLAADSEAVQLCCAWAMHNLVRSAI